ncbi:hypothetical protein ACFLSQ_11215 [Bacteroidota bacterium]
MAGWGESTIDDPELQGELVYIRNLDWTKSEVLIRNHLMTIQIPSEIDEQPWISFGFPGLTGILSGINLSGVGAFHHMGNIGSSQVNGKPHPIFFSIRNGIESKDYNNDGTSNTNDVFSAIEEKLTTGGFIINAVNAISNNDSAIVIEVNNEKGAVIRTIDDNTLINGTIIASTNHFRKLYPPETCWRYSALVSILNDNNSLSVERIWDVLSDAAGVSATLQTIQYIPSIGEVKWATATQDVTSYLQEPFIFNINDYLTTDIENNKEKSENKAPYPNPFAEFVNITLNMDVPQTVSLKIFSEEGVMVGNMNGIRVSKGENIIRWNAVGLPSGRYYCYVYNGGSKKKISKQSPVKLILIK